MRECKVFANSQLVTDTREYENARPGLSFSLSFDDTCLSSCVIIRARPCVTVVRDIREIQLSRRCHRAKELRDSIRVWRRPGDDPIIVLRNRAVSAVSSSSKTSRGIIRAVVAHSRFLSASRILTRNNKQRKSSSSDFAST